MIEGIEYQDTLLGCCGILGGWGFDRVVPSGKMIEYASWRRNEPPRLIPEMVEPKIADHEDRLTRLINLSRTNQRNCVLISLSSDEGAQRKVAENLGFKVIQSFWNPNSGNTVHIMSYLHFENPDAYDGEWD